MGSHAAQGKHFERMNTHETLMVEVEVMGHTLRLAQDPNSEHLGTTVWDASIVIAKMFEKNLRKGEFSRAKLHNKRVIELGAGMGLGGMAMALAGADVTLTDTVEVLPLLKRNCEVNLGVGKVKVCELDWFQPAQVAPLKPPFDYILATDCVYHEHIVVDFHARVMDLSSDKTTLIVANELRSHSVNNAFITVFNATHTIKRLAASKLDDEYQHPLIHVYICKKKKAKKGATAGEDVEVGEEEEEAEEAATQSHSPEAAAPSPPASTPSLHQPHDSKADEGSSTAACQEESNNSQVAGQQQSGNVDWEARRLGVQMARLMGEVQVPDVPGADKAKGKGR